MWLCRHGETEWSRDGRHTSHTDLPLTADGEAEARRMADALAGVPFDLVLTSPLRRAVDTATLAGFPEAKPDPALAEWDYGDYEGRHHRRDPRARPGLDGVDAPHPRRRVGRPRRRPGRPVIHRLIAEAPPGRSCSPTPTSSACWRRGGSRAAGFGRRLLLDTATISVLGWQREERASAAGTSPPRIERLHDALIAVLDYGIGNLRSAQKALQRVGADARLTADPG